MWIPLSGFQVGPTFPTIPTFVFVLLLFPTFFSENALLSLLFSPKMFEVTKYCNSFPRSLGLCKNQISLIWVATSHKFIKYFYFSCNSFLGTFILVFPFPGNVVVLLFRENFVYSLHLLLSLKTVRTSILSLLFMIEIPTLPYFFKLFSPTLSLLFWWRALESLPSYL